MCNSFDDRYFPRPNATPLDQETLRPLKTSLGNLTPRIDYLTPVPISGAPNTQISPDSNLANVTECKIKDAGVYGAIPNNPQRHFVSGFPNYKERANLINNATLQFVAVDFSDLPG